MRLFRHCGGIGQRHPCVGRNDLRHLTHGQGHRAVVVSCAKIGHHGATDIADLGIVEDTLEPIADVDAIFVIVDGQKYQHESRTICVRVRPHNISKATAEVSAAPSSILSICRQASLKI